MFIRNNLLLLKYKIKHIMNYGIIIKQLRVSKMKQNQTEFAKGSGITQSYLSNIEKGVKKPSIDLLESIAAYTKIPLPILFWQSISEEDIPENKKEFFKIVKPSVDNLIISVF